MSERMDQARVEAARQYGRIGGIPQDALFMFKMGAFVDGVEWADAHPYSTPEDLVAAYEDGQRDAVSKGMAKVRVTADQCNDIEDAVHEGVPLGHMLRRLGIEVRGE